MLELLFLLLPIAAAYGWYIGAARSRINNNMRTACHATMWQA